MRKTLVVGDMHVTPDDLDDATNLINGIAKVAVKEHVDWIDFLGDLHHTHSILRLEVMDFWIKSLRRLTALKTDGTAGLGNPWVRILVGNHDRPCDAGQDIHALEAYRGIPGVVVIDVPCQNNGVLYVPFQHDRERFLEYCRACDAKHLVCHQTFTGGRYESGFYAQDGINPDDVPQVDILSGHVHSAQEFGKVWYVGSSRWRTTNDVNENKYLWVLTRDEDGNIVAREPYNCNRYCRAMFLLRDTPDSPVDINGLVAPLAQPGQSGQHDYRVEIEGPPAWVDERVALYPSFFRISTIRQKESVKTKIRESEGISQSFYRHVTNYTPQFGTPKETLVELAKRNLGYAFTE